MKTLLKVAVVAIAFSSVAAFAGAAKTTMSDGWETADLPRGDTIDGRT